MGRFGEFGYAELWLPVLGAMVLGLRALWIKAKDAFGRKEQ